MGNETVETIKEFFESVLQNYTKDVEKPMIGRKFVPYSIDLLYCHLPELGLQRGGA